MPIRDSLLPEFEQEMAGTRKTLERIPDDKLSWKPHPKSGTMAWLGGHIADMVSWTAGTINQDSFDLAPPGGEPYQSPVPGSTKEILALFDKNLAEARAALEKVEDGVLLGNWTLMGGGQAYFTMPRVAVIRTFVLNHVIHHRAQLGLYLRLNDIPVPGLYGPSADESGM